MAAERAASRLGRHAAVAAALALAAALIAGGVGAARVASVQRWIAAGYWRLVLDCAVERSLRLLPLTGAAAAGVVIGLAVLRRRAARVPDVGGRGALAATGAVFAAALLLALALLADRWRTAAGPNLVLISIDTLRADHLGAYGHRVPTSPTFDQRLAAAGALFERVMSQSPKTTPSHMTLLTSLYPAVHGVEMWDDDRAGRTLNPAVHTLAEVLKAAGYATAAFTGGGNVHRARGFDQGFDVYKHSEQLARASKWIDAHRRRKFFVFVHTYAVHDPYVPAPHWQERMVTARDGRILDAVAQLRIDGGGWKPAHRLFWRSVDPAAPGDRQLVQELYDAAIRSMDEALLAPLLDRLDALDLARDTLVVFTSDHGEAFGEHGAYLHDDLYEGTLHVPLVLRFPGRIAAGRRIATPARLVDVMPTVLALLGVTAPPGLQGRSLVPLLGGPPAPGDDAPIVSEYSNASIGRTYESLRSGGLAYIVDRDAEQLFDVATDPGEQRNVAATRASDLATMRAALVSWRTACAPLAAQLGPRGPGVAADAATAQRLRALGYLDGGGD